MDWHDFYYQESPEYNLCMEFLSDLCYVLKFAYGIVECLLFLVFQTNWTD